VTEAELRALVEAGETYTVEFKGEERAPLSMSGRSNVMDGAQ